jgi:hypothetical protein
LADEKLTAVSGGENITPDGSDWKYTVTGGTTSKRMRSGSDNLLPEGFIVNGKLSVTVASNNITVALKTLSGGNPSATDPVSVWLAGSYRRCTAALSVTKNAGTNWFNSGATELAAQTVSYFAYLIWNTTPATDIMDIGFARIPYGRVYSDFSTTTTAEKYLAFGNASTPTSTDNVTVIGRFDAALSATASFNWSVPTFTNANLIQHPITETEWLTYAPTPTGFTATLPTVTAYRYKIDGNTVYLSVRQGTAGVSNLTTFTIPLPFTAKTVTNMVWSGAAAVTDNSVNLTTPGYLRVQSAATVLEVFKDFSVAAFTNSGNKGLRTMDPIVYEI